MPTTRDDRAERPPTSTDQVTLTDASSFDAVPVFDDVPLFDAVGDPLTRADLSVRGGAPAPPPPGASDR